MTPRTAYTRHHLWVLWRAPRTWGLLFAFSLGLAAMTFFFSQTAEPDLLGKNAMLERMILILMVFGMGLVSLHAADAFSGERERGTLEALMLSPLTGVDLLIAKTVGAMSLWGIVVLMGVPFAWVLAFDFVDARAAILVLVGPGTLLAIFSAGLGFMFSLRASDNKRSIASTFAVLIALFGPGFVPRIRHLSYGETILRIDPAASVGQILDMVLVKGQGWSASWLASPILGTILVAVLAMAWARRLRLDPGVVH